MKTTSLTDFLLFLPRPVKRSIALGADALMCAITVWMAFNLRLESWTAWSPAHFTAFVGAVAFALPLFIVFGLYRAIFRYAGLPALMTVLKAVAIYAVIYCLAFSVVGVPGVPRTVGVLQPLLLLLGVTLSRAFVRYWLGGVYQGIVGRGDSPRVLIYGAGSAGRQLAAALKTSPELVVVGLLDDDDRLHGQVLNGLKIYNPANVVPLVAKLRVTQVFLAIPSASRARRNEILELVRAAHVQVRTLPGVLEMAQGKVQVSDLKELDIEDLLGRDPVPPNPLMLAKNITGKVVMVTGAGGSIGSELCRQIVKAGPSVLLLVELTEFALYAIEHDLQCMLLEESPVDVRLVPLLANVRDASRMDEILRTWKPHTVYHAAAYKHVPLVEHNPAEGVKNNVLGTLNTAQLAARHGVSDFVLVSTDKAVRPTNVMGASKRLAEMLLQAIAARGDETGSPRFARDDKTVTRFSMVRFGNVLGSSGSVVPLFRKQIKDGGPITLTDERITRYFMTIPEAAQLVIQAGAMASGGDVFVLDMGEPVKIIDLAGRMVELSGLSVRNDAHPEGDIEIAITGLRPGEKLYEELLIGDNPLPTGHKRIMKAHEDFLPWPDLQAKLDRLGLALDGNDVPLIRVLLKELVPGYQPDGEVVDWVWLENGRAA
ncbi:polysaccharide biosynthesis protein [Limnohabitans planktonicus]|uniref:Polysaccharide biosynthesis protein n=1 Tax=Limnohabitans planktonicus II-D5 TaxID=1293045 RepID=A0A2T7UEL8_9BURK|nr:nucleoside-diphosphate sugar epimerase/dehydratase [Limnohabitans planktonicus]PVE43150.1 polysaccharide biosynthesis protein [Limnohabitans planktonicus II-D5]|eukprot:gene24922-31316_t